MARLPVLCGFISGVLLLAALPALCDSGAGPSAGKFVAAGASLQPRIIVNGTLQAGSNVVVAGAATVELLSSQEGARIFYTLDGTAPSAGALYTGPFVLNASATVRAIAYTSNFTQSASSGPLVITIAAPPVITTQPQSVTAVIGEAAVFSVVASGSAPLRYQWRFNGGDVAGQTNADLVLNPVQPGQGGTYDVRVYNAFGTNLSAMATLTLLTPASLSAQPTNVTVFLGENATFCVDAGGTPPLAYQWRKNGVFIPGATNSCLTLLNVEVPDAGSYSVTVANAAGATTSGDAALVIDGLPTGPPPADNFADRFSLNENGELTVNNKGATKEPGEPDHAGKPGGRSVWYAWTAPADGIATFRTAGSSFDTLLAVYTGDTVNNLTLVAADEDSGDALTSEVRFNASQNVEYEIAIDAFAGTEGELVLSWQLEASREIVPRILTQPVSSTAAVGGNSIFNVVAEPPEGLQFQWFRNGAPIADATNSVYVLTNAQTQHVGPCFVRVSHPSNPARFADSALAFQELGPVATVFSYDKLEDLLDAAVTPSRGGNGFSIAATAPAGGYISVNLGALSGQVLGTTNSGTQAGEPNHCGVLANGRTRWFGLRAVTNGNLVIDTLGSTINTVMAMYRWTNYDNLPNNVVSCDIDTKDFGSRATVTVPSQATQRPQDFLVAVDTIGAPIPTLNPDGSTNLTGLVRLNWQLGLPPVITNITPDQILAAGTNATLVVLAGNVIAPGVTNQIAPPTFQWHFDGQPMPGATSASFPINSALLHHAGEYSVTVANPFGATSAVVRVTVIDASFSTRTLDSEGATTLGVAAAGDAACPPAYQWLRNGQALPGETGPTLDVIQPQLPEAGQYSVVITACSGAVTNPVAILEIEAVLPFDLGPWPDAGAFQFPPVQVPMCSIVLEGTDALLDGPALWQPVYTNTLSGSPLQFPLPPGELNQPRRFYRARLVPCP